MLQCQIELKSVESGLNPISNGSDRAEVVTRPIWKSVEWQFRCNPIDLKSVELQRTGTIYRSNRIHPKTGIRLDRRTLLDGGDHRYWGGFGTPGAANLGGEVDRSRRDKDTETAAGWVVKSWRKNRGLGPGMAEPSLVVLERPCGLTPLGSGSSDQYARYDAVRMKMIVFC